MADPRPYKKLIRLVMRAFYPGPCPPKHHQDEGDDMARSKLAKIDTTGLGIVLLEYLLDREWVPEEQIATDLGQHHKIVRRALKFLEHEHIVMGEHRRETKRMQKTDVVKAVTATKAAQLAEATGAEANEEEEEGVVKQHTYSYWAVDFPRAYDMTQLRLLVMRKLIKDEVDAREVLAKYMCKAPQCGREYTSFDMPDLIQMDGSMQCTMCGGNVEQVLATGQTGDDEQRKERRKRLQKLLADLETQAKPIADMVLALRTAQVPHHGTLIDWAKLQQAKLHAGAMGGANEAAVRTRVAGGVTQLTAAGGAAKSAQYQEKIVMIDLGDQDGGAGATGAAPGRGAGAKAPASGAGAGKASGGDKAPALQPFFLKSKEVDVGPAGAGAHASGPAAAAAASVYAEAKPEQDEYAKEMLARLAGHQAAASPDFGGPPAKRLKTEEAVKLEPKQEEAAAAGEDEEWEDI